MSAAYKLVRDGARNVAEQRLVMEARIGARLLPEQVVHHRNGNKRDNRIENLELMLDVMHLRMHANERAGRIDTLEMPAGCVGGREARERLEIAIARAGGVDALSRKWGVSTRRIVLARTRNAPMPSEWLTAKLGLRLESVYRVDEDAADPRKETCSRPPPCMRDP